MPNLIQSTALLACFFVMGMDTSALDEISDYTPSQAVIGTIIIVECDTDTDCMEKNPHLGEYCS